MHYDERNSPLFFFFFFKQSCFLIKGVKGKKRKFEGGEMGELRGKGFMVKKRELEIYKKGFDHGG